MTAPGSVDLALGLLLLVSVVAGLWRGLVYEILALLGWVAAFIAAQRFAQQVSDWLPVGVPGSALNTAAGFAVAFVAALLAWGLAAALVRRLVRASPLSGVDRLLGAAFGLARGGVILLVVATLVMLTPARESRGWQTSVLAAVSMAALTGLKPALPEALARHLPSVRELRAPTDVPASSI